jgi:hypothetical protein
VIQDWKTNILALNRTYNDYKHDTSRRNQSYNQDNVKRLKYDKKHHRDRDYQRNIRDQEPDLKLHQDRYDISYQNMQNPPQRNFRDFENQPIRTQYPTFHNRSISQERHDFQMRDQNQPITTFNQTEIIGNQSTNYYEDQIPSNIQQEIEDKSFHYTRAPIQQNIDQPVYSNMVTLSDSQRVGGVTILALFSYLITFSYPLRVR